MVPVKEVLKKVIPNKCETSSNPLPALTKQENDFLDSLGAPKIKNCSDEVLGAILGTGLINLGLKTSGLDKILLTTAFVELRSAYGNLTIKELKLAFEMATRLQLDFNPETYQNFSILYLNKLLIAYKKWSTETYEFLRPHGDRQEEKEKTAYSPYLLENKSVNKHRKEIQLGLENFRNGILSQANYIPYEWYRVLSEDGFIAWDDGAIMYHNKKVSELTEYDRVKLKRGQDYVWQLFELAGDKNLYEPEK